MRFEGKVWKDGKHWLVEVPLLDIVTQGSTKKDALYMIADAIEGYVNKPNFKITVHSGKRENIEIEASDEQAMVALLLQRRRQASGLTLAEVAKRLGAKSHNSFARYEQGKSKPTVQKLLQLLSVVDTDRDIVLGRSHL